MRKTNWMIGLGAAAVAVLTMNSAAHAGLIAEWNLNAGSGTTISESGGTTSADFSSLGANAPTWGSAAPYTNSTASLDFHGGSVVNQLDTNMSGAALGGTGTGGKSATFVAWINADAGAAWGNILSYSPTFAQTNGGDLRLKLDGNGHVRGEVSGGAFADTSGLDLRGAGWKMVAVIFNDNTNTSKVYVQGEGLVTPATSSSRAIDAAGTASNGGTIDFVIGGGQNGSNFTGGIDHVQVYDTALSGSQLDALAAPAATPEPASIAIALVGVGLLLGARRPRRA